MKSFWTFRLYSTMKTGHNVITHKNTGF